VSARIWADLLTLVDANGNVAGTTVDLLVPGKVGGMLARQRQARIVDQVRRHGGVRVSDLTALLEVSDMTVRRDLEELARQGLVEKVHGGAVAAGLSAEEPGFEVKSGRERREKAAVARAAAGLVRPGQAVAIGAGTTTWALATLVAEVPGVTVVTNSVRVADAFTPGARAAGQTVVLTGGVRTPSDALVGPLADAAIRSLNVDLLFLGVHGMDPGPGFTTPNLAEAETNRAFLAHARRSVIVTDHTKWRTVGLCAFAPLSAADVLVTDERIDAEARTVLGEAVGELVLARVRHPLRRGGGRDGQHDGQRDDEEDR
jgi:DeoR/GlpR family transcriptional regulator of sugar metabolism